MHRTPLNKKQWLLGGLAALSSLFTLQAQAADSTTSGWEFSVEPYLWAVSVNGSLNYSVPSVSNVGSGGGLGDSRVGQNMKVTVGKDNSDLFDLDNLKMAFLLRGEARKNEWAMFGDMVYMDFKNDNSVINSVNSRVLPRETTLDAKTELQGYFLQLAVGRTFGNYLHTNIEPFVGMRYFHLETTTDWTLNTTFVRPDITIGQSGSVSKDKDFYDAIIGVRGRIALSDSGSWFIPYYLDGGAGNSNTSLQAEAGIGYSPSWWAVKLTYRYLGYWQDDDKFMKNLEFQGPAISAVFRF